VRPRFIASTPSTTYTTTSTSFTASQPLANIAPGRIVTSISAAVSNVVSMV
jgi:hypothetical protein